MKRRQFLAAVASCAVLLGQAAPSRAQRKGEYLTEGEMDLVKEMRDIANRTEVFLKIANRRLLAIGGAEYKDERFRKYGPLPTGSQIELLDDYHHAIDELMIKLDDEFERAKMSESMKKALGFVGPEIERQIKELKALKPKLTERDVERYYKRALESAELLQEGTRNAAQAVKQ